ncbi:hypothetical protein ARAM_006621 [Aspergillus rambellii]|uniref:Sulfotransferase domain-containing protein n=1 Tax=Aspergillus rambellii TaxID=308745 RepID=A0A0F8U806_9EURO|nr:hypothetical protein ARAM_006621 [Aspergillus rambellii]
MSTVPTTKNGPESRLLIVTYPRTASNLLMRMLAMPDQPHAVCVESGGYFFMPTSNYISQNGLWEKPCKQWTEEQRVALENKFQSCFEELHGFLQGAETQGKIAVFKEHAPFIISPTVQSRFVHGPEIIATETEQEEEEEEEEEAPWRVGIPDPYRDIQPPANLPLNESVLAFPSYYRVFLSFMKGDLSKMQGCEAEMREAFTLRWTRNLYDWYVSAWEKMHHHHHHHPGEEQKKTPIILDADDVLNNPELVLRFCDLVGLDSTRVQFTWKPAGQEQLEKEAAIRLITRSTLFASSGINAQGKTFEGLSMEGEVAKWKQEFGDVEGAKLERWVKDAMPDYEYLLSRRLTL